MSDRLAEWTPERWERARKVLAGETDTRVSFAAAARAAGVKAHVLHAWINRSRDRLPDDDPLIHEMAEVVDSRKELLAGRLEDVAWKRAIHGELEPVFYKGVKVASKRKVDNRVLMRMLEAKNQEEYGRRPSQVTIKIGDEAEIHQRLLAGLRMAQAKQELAKPTIELPESEFEEIFE